jgi:deoxycytidine triphosphate deaminase
MVVERLSNFNLNSYRKKRGANMLLNEAEIRSRGIIQNGQQDKFRDTGYDLTVGLIIDTKGNDHPDQFTIGPNGIIEVISAETLKIPENVTGFAHVKTSLVDNGLLPLNIGIIDPGWEGRLSATLVNFGDGETKFIQRGDVFLRVTFMEHKQSKLAKVNAISDSEYIKLKRKKIAQNFGETFLGLHKFKHELTKEFDGKLTASEARVLPLRASVIVGIIALLLVAVQLGATYFVAVDPWHWIGQRWEDVATKAQLEQAKSQSADAFAAAKQAKQEVDEIRTELNSLKEARGKHVVTPSQPANTRANDR